MTREEIQGYWKMSIAMARFPEEAFQKDPNVIAFAQAYANLEKRYFDYMTEINTPPALSS